MRDPDGIAPDDPDVMVDGVGMTPDQRAAFLAFCQHYRAGASPRLIHAAFVAALFLGLATATLYFRGERAWPVWLFLTFMPASFAGWSIARSLVLGSRGRRRRMRAFGVEVCVRCGYWLGPLDASIQQCPECGARRRPMMLSNEAALFDERSGVRSSPSSPRMAKLRDRVEELRRDPSS
jgi:hypothetical protein